MNDLLILYANIPMMMIATITSKNAPISTISGIPWDKATAPRNRPFSIIRRPTVSVMAFLRVHIISSPIRIMDTDNARQFLSTVSMEVSRGSVM